MGGLAERSVRVVIRAAISGATESAPALPAYGCDSRAYRQSPALPIQRVMAASAAVAARRMRGPRLTATALRAARIIEASSGVKPPSGPIRTVAGPASIEERIGAPTVSSAK